MKPKELKSKNKRNPEPNRLEESSALAGEDRKFEQEFITVNRSYKLKCFPTNSKHEISRYTTNRYNLYLNENIKRVWGGENKISTKGKGQLYNKALHKAKGVVSSTKKSAKALKRKAEEPCVESLFSRVKVTPSKKSKFDYWVTVENQFKKTGIKVPCKSHRALNKALKNNWTLSNWGDLHYNREKNEFYLQVFLEKRVPKAKPTKKFIGVDVGLNHAYSSSDGHHAPGLKSLRIRMNKRIADRARYKTEKIKQKTTIKQRLNQYAKELVDRVYKSERGLAFERPVTIGKLSRRRLQGWAGAYLANRTSALARELGIYVHEVNPAYTSQTCPKCSYKDKRNRSGVIFSCINCGYKGHADFVGALNIARRASGETRKSLIPAALAVSPEREARGV